MNRFDRVISTLVLLQSKKVIKSTSISERFGISKRTVYRDIKTLKMAGVPIIGDPGIGYSIMEGYRLPPVMFNEGESSALLTAEKFIGKLTERNTQAYYSSAMMKIRAILRSSEKQSLEILDDSIAILENKREENKTYLQDLFKSIAAKQVLNIEYQKADGTSSARDLEPIGCYYKYKNWYLIAFCKLKEDYRTFKVNRIVNLKLLDSHFDTEHISLQNYIEQQSETWKEAHQFQNFEIAFNKSLVEFAERRKYYFGFVEQRIEKNAIYMKFQNSSVELMAHWIIQFGNQVRVISPPELKDRLKVMATQLYNHYK